ncbi:hypothetical protein [uncultured Gimesia sp.]|uniref:hypothetical protein n=1 Tax=uncultured Gimesia sp. TaxID=1678688 RepID=UPI000E9CB6EF|nr:hypothetical protein [Planctomycetaceae bacterium]HBL43050.1 hypothetical protein [Planctomycetaceae bacterium]|tara:strand:+ start:499 stop:1347 length:849 start_codon:yes stop_codon:yes gene_type:complete
MSLPEFKNEAEFRTEWIAPFLSKLGYILPTHNHGTGEQGKDFFFAEYDKFGHLRFNAAQVKLGNIGGGDSQLSELLHQVRSCFDVTLDYDKGTKQKRISAVYIMTNGSISHEAKRRISGYCEREHFGENVFYLDGDTLDNLERHATFTDDKKLRNRLVALLNEVNYNFAPFKEMANQHVKNLVLIDSSRILALEDTLRNPLPENILSYKGVSVYWEAVNMFKNILRLEIDGSLVETQIQKMEKGINESSERLRDSISKAIAKIDSMYKLDIRVIKPEEESGS